MSMPSPQFKLWSVVDERTVCRFTSDAKDRPSRELLAADVKPTQCSHVHCTMNWNYERSLDFSVIMSCYVIMCPYDTQAQISTDFSNIVHCKSVL